RKMGAGENGIRSRRQKIAAGCAVSRRAGRDRLQTKRLPCRQEGSRNGAAVECTRSVYAGISRHHLFPRRKSGSRARLLESCRQAAAQKRRVCAWVEVV